MSEISIAITAPEKVISLVISHLNEGQIADVLAFFGDEFTFKDHGIGLEFTSKDRLKEFFQRARELYTDMLVQVDTIFVSGVYALTEWTIQTTLIEPAYGNWKRRVPILLHGASAVLIENGRITSWSDYYDGLVSRRTALASYFTEWVEL